MHHASRVGTCWTGPVVGLLAAVALLGCGSDAGPRGLSGAEEYGLLRWSGRPAAPGTEVTPTTQQPTGTGENKTVAPAWPGEGTPASQDTNTNQSFTALGIRLPAGGLTLEYHTGYGPLGISPVFNALTRAVLTWQYAAPNSTLFGLDLRLWGTKGPGRDGFNVVGWRHFQGEAWNALAAAWVWDNGERIVEADIFFNTRHPWATNPAIAPGENRLGDVQAYDLQAVITHELGHALGLVDVTDDGNPGNGNETDATMHRVIRRGELSKQTLTPGDRAGVLHAAP